MNTKRRGNVPPQNEYEERESLISGGIEMTTSKQKPSRGGATSPVRREKRKTSALMGKGSDAEERVSLMGGGAGGRRPGGGGRRPLRIADTRRRTISSMLGFNFNFSRMMRYVGLMLASATFSFLLFYRQSKTVHWEEYNKILQPDVGKATRCYVSTVSITSKPEH